MKNILSASALVFLLLACSKDKFTTKPQLELISVSTEEVQAGDPLVVVLGFTDKEGDASDTLFITKQRLNARTVSRTLRDTLRYVIPQFPGTNQGQFELDLSYQNELISAEQPPRVPGSNPPIFEPDTLAIKFVVRDKAGNKSDSLIIGPIAVLR